MEIQNTSRIPTKELRRLFSKIITKALLDTDAKLYLRSGLYIQVNNAKYSRARGWIYPDAVSIHRKGKLLVVNSYIKIFVFAHTTMDDITHTFAHWRKERRSTVFNLPISESSSLPEDTAVLNSNPRVIIMNIGKTET